MSMMPNPPDVKKGLRDLLERALAKEPSKECILRVLSFLERSWPATRSAVQKLRPLLEHLISEFLETHIAAHGRQSADARLALATGTLDLLRWHPPSSLSATQLSAVSLVSNTLRATRWNWLKSGRTACSDTAYALQWERIWEGANEFVAIPFVVCLPGSDLGFVTHVIITRLPTDRHVSFIETEICDSSMRRGDVWMAGARVDVPSQSPWFDGIVSFATKGDPERWLLLFVDVPAALNGQKIRDASFGLAAAIGITSLRTGVKPDFNRFAFGGILDSNSTAEEAKNPEKLAEQKAKIAAREGYELIYLCPSRRAKRNSVFLPSPSLEDAAAKCGIPFECQPDERPSEPSTNKARYGPAVLGITVLLAMVGVGAYAVDTSREIAFRTPVAVVQKPIGATCSRAVQKLRASDPSSLEEALAEAQELSSSEAARCFRGLLRSSSEPSTVVLAASGLIGAPVESSDSTDISLVSTALFRVGAASSKTLDLDRIAEAYLRSATGPGSAGTVVGLTQDEVAGLKLLDSWLGRLPTLPGGNSVLIASPIPVIPAPAASLGSSFKDGVNQAPLREHGVFIQLFRWTRLRNCGSDPSGKGQNLRRPGMVAAHQMQRWIGAYLGGWEAWFPMRGCVAGGESVPLGCSPEDPGACAGRGRCVEVSLDTSTGPPSCGTGVCVAPSMEEHVEPNCAAALAELDIRKPDSAERALELLRDGTQEDSHRCLSHLLVASEDWATLLVSAAELLRLEPTDVEVMRIAEMLIRLIDLFSREQLDFARTWIGYARAQASDVVSRVSAGEDVEGLRHSDLEALANLDRWLELIPRPGSVTLPRVTRDRRSMSFLDAHHVARGVVYWNRMYECARERKYPGVVAARTYLDWVGFYIGGTRAFLPVDECTDDIMGGDHCRFSANSKLPLCPASAECIPLRLSFNAGDGGLLATWFGVCVEGIPGHP